MKSEMHADHTREITSRLSYLLCRTFLESRFLRTFRHLRLQYEKLVNHLLESSDTRLMYLFDTLQTPFRTHWIPSFSEA